MKGRTHNTTGAGGGGHVMLPWPHPACLSDEQLLAACTVGRGRAGGPGGQNRNKVETLVMIKHEPTGIEAHAGERRSQIENKQVAVRRLRLLLATQHRCAPPSARGRTLDELLAPSGSDLWRSRRSGTRIVCNPEHHDFAPLLAEALDIIADSDWDAAKAARRLEISTSQLVRFVQDHPPAMQVWNAERVKHGMRLLK